MHISPRGVGPGSGIDCRHLAHAQIRTAVFEDGNKLDYNVLSESPDDLKPMAALGHLLEGALYGAQIDKWIPGKARIQFTTSLAGSNLLMPSEDSLFVDGTRPAGRSWRLRGHRLPVLMDQDQNQASVPPKQVHWVQ